MSYYIKFRKGDLSINAQEMSAMWKSYAIGASLAIIDRKLEVAGGLSVINATTHTPPGSPTVGDRYIAAGGGTWTQNHIYTYRADATWDDHTPVEPTLVWNLATNAYVVWNGVAWVASASGSTSSLDNGATLNDAGGNDAVLSFTTQTVGSPTLTIPDFANVDDTFSFVTLAQTLLNKSLTAPAITGGTAIELTGFSLRSTGAAFDLVIATTAVYTADRTLTVNIPTTGNAALTLAGDLVTTAGNVTITAQAGGSQIVLPTGGATTLAMTLVTGTAVTGDTWYWNGTAVTRLAAAAAGLALIATGVGSAPMWGTPVVGATTQLNGPVTLNDGGATDALLAFTTQTVGQPTLTIPDFASVSDTFCFIGLAQTLTNKTLTTPDINGGTVDNVTSLGIRSTGAAFDLILATTAVYGANRTLTINIPTAGNAALTLTGNLVMVGAFNLEFTITGNTTVTLPTTGTLATRAGAEALTNKTLNALNSWFIKDGAAGRGMKVDASTMAGDFFTTLNVGNPVADAVLTLPIATTTIVGHDTTNTLTNKTINADGTGNVISNINGDELDPITPGAATYGICPVLAIPFTDLAAAGQNIFADNAPFAFRVIDMHVVATTADGGTVVLNKGKVGALGTAITNTFTPGADKAVTRATSIDDAQHEIAANGSLVLVGDGGGTVDGIAYITILRIN